MSHDIESEENIALLCLGSVVRDETIILQLESAGINVYEFDDADEYMQYLLSLPKVDTCIFVWLGFGWNYLIPILDDFDQIFCIYLSEPTEEKRVLKVHGVFTDVAVLLQQLLIDARIYQLNQSTHLNILDIDERSMIQNTKGNVAHSMWSSMLLQALLRMPIPTTDMYREMLDEARFFYKNNPAQIAEIDRFQQNYRKEDAINWYTRDSFTYRLTNKAFRTQNLAIIFKFRTFIRDVYEQLTKLHHDQNLAVQTRNPQQPKKRLYRAMRVSSTEGNYLRSCQNGTIISIRSFVSASQNKEVAIKYLGPDPQRDIMLEISIDPTLLNSNSSPFANISTLSAFPYEEEVLLSMGTILQIQSNTILPEKKNICIQAQLCHEETTEVKELKTYILKQMPDGHDESFYISVLENFLIQTNDQKRLEQVLKLRKPDTTDDSDELYRSWIRLGNLSQHSVSISRAGPYISDFLSRLNQGIQDLGSHPNLSNSLRCSISGLHDLTTNLSSCLNSLENTGNLDKALSQLTSLSPLLEQQCSLLPLPSVHPIFSQLKSFKCALESLQDGRSEALEQFATEEPSSIASLLDNDNHLSPATAMALGVHTLHHNDHSLQFLENLNKSTKPQAHILRQLGRCYEKHEDLSMAIAYYRTVIEECNLPPNSIEIVEAYISIGSVFVRLQDIESALWNYSRARDLLLQHHPSTHPLLKQIQNHLLIQQCKQQCQQILKRLNQN